MAEQIRIEKAAPSMFEEVLPLLREGFRHDGAAHWRRMIFEPGWEIEEDYRGWLMFDGPRAVGFLGVVFSTQQVDGHPHRFSNLSSWIVLPEYRKHSGRLLDESLSLHDHTVTGLTPIPPVARRLERAGFHVLEREVLLLPPALPPLLRGRLARCQVLLDAEAIAAIVEGEARRVFEDHATSAVHRLLLLRGPHQCLVISVPTVFSRVPCNHVLYVSDPSMFQRYLGHARWGMFRQSGRPFALVERRQLPRGSYRLALARPYVPHRYYRPARGSALRPDQVQLAYSELVNLKM